MDIKQKRILLIEDDQFLREFYQELLSTEGFLVDAVEDGEKGSEKIHEGGYDLILLDIMLPKKDGVQVLRDNQANPPKNKNGPIVVLTNLGQESVINACLTNGASGYLIKSALDPNQVLSEIKNYLNAPKT